MPPGFQRTAGILLRKANTGAASVPIQSNPVQSNPVQSTTSKRSDCGGWAHSSSAPAMATARSGLARQVS